MCGNINCKRNKIWDPMWLLYVAVFPALGATAHCSPFSYGVFRVVKTQSATRKKDAQIELCVGFAFGCAPCSVLVVS